MARTRSQKAASPEDLALAVTKLTRFVQAAELVQDHPGRRWKWKEIEAVLQSAAKNTIHGNVRKLQRLFGGDDLIDVKNGKLTPLGRRVFEWAKGVVEAHGAWRHLPIGGREQIVIGVTGTVDSFILPGLIDRFQREAKGKADVRIRIGSIEHLLGELHSDRLDVAICGIPEHAGRGELVVEDVWVDIPTVMIAAEKTEPKGGNVPPAEDWGYSRTWARHDGRVRLHEVRKDVVCVLESDLKGVLAVLPRPTRGGGRILVDRYASILSIVQTGAAVGFVPLLGKAEKWSEYPGHPRLLCYRIAETDGVPLRKVCLWRTKRQVEQEAKQRSMVTAFLDIVRRNPSGDPAAPARNPPAPD